MMGDLQSGFSCRLLGYKAQATYLVVISGKKNVVFVRYFRKEVVQP